MYRVRALKMLIKFMLHILLFTKPFHFCVDWQYYCKISCHVSDFEILKFMSHFARGFEWHIVNNFHN